MKPSKSNAHYSLLILVAAGLTAALPARAQTNLLSDEIKFVPLSIDIFVPEAGPPGSEFLPAFAPNPLGGPDAAVILTEGLNGPASDVIWSQQGYFYFSSDNESGQIPTFPTAIPVVGVLTETGALQDVGGYFGLPSGTLLISSDVTVPEPSAFGLGALALGLLALRRSRR